MNKNLKNVENLKRNPLFKRMVDNIEKMYNKPIEELIKEAEEKRILNK